jgi:arylsulfatase A-like enzyme
MLLSSIGAAQPSRDDAAAVTPGEFIVEPPTLINLGFEWHIDGDANRNARVAVSYRKAGEVQRLHDFKMLDFRLKPGAAAIDRGVTLPNINDSFAGKAPDLGALEAGPPLPVDGPRPGATIDQAPRRPNIVIIFADDLGYGDLGAFGSPNNRTPRLDAMAADGQKWTGFYVQPVCSPSRAALLTGRLPIRNGMFGSPGGTAPKVFRDNAAQGLPLEEITLAELLKSAGYRTGMVGKWHLGQLPRFLPMRQGFDSWFGLPYSHDMRMTVPRDNGFRTPAYYAPKPEYWDVALMRNEQVIERPVDHRTLTKRYTDEAVRFITENKTAPFFLYLAHSLPHIPLARSDEFVGRSAGGIYGDTIEEIDWSVGKILDALRAAGIERNTLVLFTSDNGPWLPFRDHGGSAGPLRQGKGTTWEGGVRTPAIFWWPGTVRPGVVTGIGSGLDLLATAASLAGARLPADRRIDSIDLSAALIDGGPSPRHELFYYWDSELRAVRHDNYKAHFITSGAYDDAEPRTVHDPPLLFDLAVDPGERVNVAAQHPGVVADLIELANTHRETVVATKPLFDVLLPKPRD